jgi:hypothetical protein
MIHTSCQIVGDRFKEDDMKGACGMHGQEEKCIQGSDGENLKERDHLEYVGLDGRIIKIGT